MWCLFNAAQNRRKAKGSSDEEDADEDDFEEDAAGAFEEPTGRPRRAAARQATRNMKVSTGYPYIGDWQVKQCILFWSCAACHWQGATAPAVAGGSQPLLISALAGGAMAQ